VRSPSTSAVAGRGGRTGGGERVDDAAGYGA
jgi:hypothetical protein